VGQGRVRRTASRPVEALALVAIAAVVLLGFVSAAAAGQLRQGLDPGAVLPQVLLQPLLSGGLLLVFHIFLRLTGLRSEQVIWPVVSLLFVIGLMMIYRLRGEAGVWQQMTRGFIPGLVIAGVLVARPQLIETIRRLAVPAGIAGLLLPLLTALFGVVDETGARLALKIGPLPSIQTTELIKLALIIFLAWYIEREGRAAEARAHTLLIWMRLPALQYFVPGVLVVTLATLALVPMSDYGAVLILGAIFIAMLYTGFETRLFFTIAAIGLALAALVGVVLAFTWEVPAVIQYRFLAFRDPWSTDMILVNGQPTGITIAEGPGYQIQQAVYAVIAGGITGTGLGFGTPGYIPLAHSDFILAAIIEEMGAATGLALLALFAVLLMRIFRIVFLLPPGQVFERLLLVGIGVHFFTQVFVMAGGTLSLIPMTGITIPFVSLGGTALLVNLVEIGIALAIVRRMEGYRT